MNERIFKDSFKSLVMDASEASDFIKNGDTVGIGGYTSSGYPKAVIRALAKRKTDGENIKINVVTGANNGPSDTMLAEADLVDRRAPMIEGKAMASLINANRVQYCEQQMNKMPRLIRTGAFGNIKTVVLEATAINEEGYVIPTSSVGMLPNLLDCAENVIVEINTGKPLSLIGFHDIYRVDGNKPIPLEMINQRIGEPYLKIDKNKIKGIVYCEEDDVTTSYGEKKPEEIAIGNNLLNFLEIEAKRVGWKKLPPIQTGFGSMASSVVEAIGESSFNNIEFFCGGLQEANMKLLISGKASQASCGSIQMTPAVIRMFENDYKELLGRLLIRNGEITNNAETIGRFQPITLTGGIEIDIYGNVNSSHISGNKVVNGLGGGANFAQNAGLSVVIMASANKKGAISNIVPMVSHQDISEHDIDVIVTEHGVADLRGKTDRERAEEIIENCSGIYKEQLRDYFERACKKGGHHPIILEECLSWHSRLQETGTMMK